MGMKSLLSRSPVLKSLAKSSLGFYRDVRSQLRKRWLIRRRSPLIDAYLTSHQVRKLQIGAGPVALDGWLNSDINPRRESDIFLDAYDPFPFPDHSFDYIFTEHLLQHLPYQSAKAMLRECRRVLKPGGRIRVAVPCLWSLASLCGDNPSDRQLALVRWYIDNVVYTSDGYAAGFVLNGFFNEGEAFLFDPQTLRLALEKSGFADVTVCSIGQSGDDHLRGLESHGQVLGDETVNRFETLVMEAVAPTSALPSGENQTGTLVTV